jgi:hypothetical protein
MTRVFAIALAVVLGLSPAVAAAQERLGDAALGAISGAIVGGPIGAARPSASTAVPTCILIFWRS